MKQQFFKITVFVLATSALPFLLSAAISTNGYVPNVPTAGNQTTPSASDKLTAPSVKPNTLTKPVFKKLQVRGKEGVDYAKGEVVIVFKKDKVDLTKLLAKTGIKKGDKILKEKNNLLKTAGINNPLISFVKPANLAVIKTNPGQNVVQLIKKLKNNQNIKIIPKTFVW